MELLRNNRRRVVITGIGVISALGAKQAFWNALKAGKSGIKRLQNIETDHLAVKIGGEVRDFDSTQYIPPKEARRMGRTTQFAIVAAHRAVEDAGLTPDDIRANGERVGTVIGTTLGSYEIGEESIRNWKESGFKRATPTGLINALPNMPSHYVSRIMGALGPLITPSVACATGSQAIGEATDLITLGKCDMVIAGGVDSVMFDYIIAGYNAMRALTTEYNDNPEESSRPFDANRSGFVLGEGAAIYVIESLESALKRNANIQAEILGYATSADAYHVAAPDPDGAGARRAMQWALKDAHISSEDVDYVNAHGTSTPANDSIETLAIKHVFGERAYNLPISSTKSMIGHAMSACGALELTACVMSLQDKVIHPTINYETPDPECDLDYVPNDARDVPNIKIAMSNSFGLGGQNAAIVVGRI